MFEYLQMNIFNLKIFFRLEDTNVFVYLFVQENLHLLHNAIVSSLTAIFVLQRQQNIVLKKKKKKKKNNVCVRAFFHPLKAKGSSLKIMN